MRSMSESSLAARTARMKMPVCFTSCLEDDKKRKSNQSINKFLHTLALHLSSPHRLVQIGKR